MKSPKREMQQLLDYLRHKVLRRIKKRRKRLQESALKLAEKWLKHKIRRPQYADGKDDDVIYAEPTLTIYRLMKDIGLDPETGEYVDNTTGLRGSLRLPEFTVNWDRRNNRMMTSDEVTKNFYRKHIPYSSSFDGGLITAPTDWLVEKVIGPSFNALLSGFANYGTTPQQLSDPNYQAFMQGLTQQLGEGLSYTMPSRYLDTGNTTLNFAMDMLAGKYAPKVVKAGTKYVGRKTAPIWMPWMLERGIRNATKTGEIRVGEDYFNSPYNWYRVAALPEKWALEEAGKNITSRDSGTSPELSTYADDYRISRMDYDHTGRNNMGNNVLYALRRGDDGFLYLNKTENIDPFGFMGRKTGSAHGNRSLASWGIPWQGSIAGSGSIFPRGIIEGGANMIDFGKTRSVYLPRYIEDVPIGSRVGFKTGEMPMDNLSWFLRQPDGTYSYEPIIPEKRITINQTSGNKSFEPRVVTEDIARTNAELDAAYGDAVARGDRKTALKMLDEAYKRSGIPKTEITMEDSTNPKIWYTGSEYGNHTIFDSSKFNATIGGESAAGKVKGNFLTTDLPSAARYAGSNMDGVKMFTEPNTFFEKLQNIFGKYKPERIHPTERVPERLRPKPDRLYTSKGGHVIDYMDETDNIVYPMYVNPGENVFTVNFEGAPWSQSPVKFPNMFSVMRTIRDDIAKTYRDEIVPFKDRETAIKYYKSLEDRFGKQYVEDPSELSKKYFQYPGGDRHVQMFASAPTWEKAYLIETHVPATTNGAVQTAANEGYTSVYIPNVIDSNVKGGAAPYAIDDFVTLNSNQMKIADITYDDAGNLIPLSKRFNWNNPDIRYGLLPLTYVLKQYFGQNNNNLNSDISKPVFKHGKGSGIHIKPKNRGKFNATKKRTGKTTALLAHSKNPLTRKRAIFALNAKKWKH